MDRKRILFTNNCKWHQVYCYFWSSKNEYVTWPGLQMKKIGTNGFGEELFEIYVPAGVEFLVFTDQINKTVDIKHRDLTIGYFVTGRTKDGKYLVTMW